MKEEEVKETVKASGCLGRDMDGGLSNREKTPEKGENVAFVALFSKQFCLLPALAICSLWRKTLAVSENRDVGFDLFVNEASLFWANDRF